MQRTIGWLRWTFLGLFALAIVGIWTYQLGWVNPRQRCERAHRWWSDEDRQCATPVSVSVFTGRPIPGSPVGAPVRTTGAYAPAPAGAAKR